MLGPEFVRGWQWYLDHLPEHSDPAARIVIRVFIAGQEFNALLDTGANGCVLPWSVAEHLLPDLVNGVSQTRALGGNVHTGRSCLVSLTFIADEGKELTVETVAWASETFPGPSLVGYAGLLEKLRMALDPEENRFYFGG
jgi:predicted aspartyl protease